MALVFLVFHDAADGRIIKEFERDGASTTFFLPNRVENNVYMRQEEPPDHSGTRIDLHDDYATVSAYDNSNGQTILLTGNKTIEVPWSTWMHQKSIVLREHDQILSSAGRWSLEWHHTGQATDQATAITTSSSISPFSQWLDFTEQEEHESKAEVRGDVLADEIQKIREASEMMERRETDAINKAACEVEDVQQQSLTPTAPPSTFYTAFWLSPVLTPPNTETGGADHKARSDEEKRRSVKEAVANKLAADQVQAKQELHQAHLKYTTSFGEEQEEPMQEAVVRQAANDQARAEKEKKKAVQMPLADAYSADQAQAVQSDVQARAKSVTRADEELKNSMQVAVAKKLADDMARARQESGRNRDIERSTTIEENPTSESQIASGYKREMRSNTPITSAAPLDTDHDQMPEEAAIKSADDRDVERDSEEKPELTRLIEHSSQLPDDSRLLSQSPATTTSAQSNTASRGKQEGDSLNVDTSLEVDSSHNADPEQNSLAINTIEEITVDATHSSCGCCASQPICRHEAGSSNSIRAGSEESTISTNASVMLIQSSKPMKRRRRLDGIEDVSIPLVKMIKQAPSQDEISDDLYMKTVKRCRSPCEVEDDSMPPLKKTKLTTSLAEESNTQAKGMSKPTIVRLGELDTLTTHPESDDEDQTASSTNHANSASQSSSNVPRPAIASIKHLFPRSPKARLSKIKRRKTKRGIPSVDLATPSSQSSSTTPSSSAADNISRGLVRPKIIFSTTTSKVSRNQKVINSYRRLGGSVVDDIQKANLFCVGGNSLRKTAKFILALALGKRIVTDKWLEDACTRKEFPDPQHYLPKDAIHEKEWQFNLAEAVDRGGCGMQLLNSFDVYFTLQMQEELGELKHDVKQIALTLGANRVLMKIPDAIAHDRKIIIIGSTNNERQAWRAEKFNQKLYNRDLLLMAVLRGKLELDSEEFVIKKPVIIKEEE